MARRKKAEQEQPQTETPAQGHNSGVLSDDEKRALLVEGVTDLEALLVKKNEIVAEVRNQRKRIISYGFDAFEIDYALKLRKEEDGEMVERRRREAAIARFLNHPIGSQLDWVEAIDRTPSVDKAYEDGKVSGAAGETAKSPHAPGTPQEQRWLEGWHDGQAALASGFKKIEEHAAEEAESELEDA